MSDTPMAIAVGFDQTTLTLIEAIVTDSPSLMPDLVVSEQLPIKRRTLDGAAQRNGKRTLRWEWEWMSREDFAAWLDFVFPAGVASQNVTLVTLSERGQYVPCNAIADRPVPGEDFEYWHGGDVRNLAQSFFDVELLAAVDNSLLLENGLGMQLETGEYLLTE